MTFRFEGKKYGRSVGTDKIQKAQIARQQRDACESVSTRLLGEGIRHATVTDSFPGKIVELAHRVLNCDIG